MSESTPVESVHAPAPIDPEAKAAQQTLGVLVQAATVPIGIEWTPSIETACGMLAAVGPLEARASYKIKAADLPADISQAIAYVAGIADRLRADCRLDFAKRLNASGDLKVSTIPPGVEPFQGLRGPMDLKEGNREAMEGFGASDPPKLDMLPPVWLRKNQGLQGSAEDAAAVAASPDVRDPLPESVVRDMADQFVEQASAPAGGTRSGGPPTSEVTSGGNQVDSQPDAAINSTPESAEGSGPTETLDGETAAEGQGSAEDSGEEQAGETATGNVDQGASEVASTSTASTDRP